MSRIKRLALGLGSAAIISGCGVVLPSSDSFVMYGTEESLRAYHDSLNGLIANSKTTDPMGNSAYWDSRQHQERERSKRACSTCGFWQKLTGGSDATTHAKN